MTGNFAFSSLQSYYYFLCYNGIVYPFVLRSETQRHKAQELNFEYNSIIYFAAEQISYMKRRFNISIAIYYVLIIKFVTFSDSVYYCW